MSADWEQVPISFRLNLKHEEELAIWQVLRDLDKGQVKAFDSRSHFIKTALYEYITRNREEDARRNKEQELQTFVDETILPTVVGKMEQMEETLEQKLTNQIHDEVGKLVTDVLMAIVTGGYIKGDNQFTATGNNSHESENREDAQSDEIDKKKNLSYGSLPQADDDGSIPDAASAYLNNL